MRGNSNKILCEDTMGFKPLHDRVLLRRVGEEEKSAGESSSRIRLKKSRRRES